MNKFRFSVFTLSLALCVTASVAKPLPKAPVDPLAGLGGTGHGSYAVMPDPKRPGKLLWKMWVRDFSMQSPSSGVTGTLLGVTAVLFEKGQPAATMSAPKAQGDYTNRSIVASGAGGVSLRSLTELGTTLHSDKIFWDAKTNTITAIGHVVYENGKTHARIETPQLVADTVLKTIRSSSGGHVTIPKGF